MSGLVDGGMGWGEEGGDSIVTLIWIFLMSFIIHVCYSCLAQLLDS